MLKSRHYSIQDIQDEARDLVARGSVGKQNRIYELAKYFGYGDWRAIERLLEINEYVLRDNIIDLVGAEAWIND
jgi:hypothetical protein